MKCIHCKHVVVPKDKHNPCYGECRVKDWLHVKLQCQRLCRDYKWNGKTDRWVDMPLFSGCDTGGK